MTVAPRTALIFPGQGSQRPGMLETIPELDSLDRLLDAAEALSGLELRTIAYLGGAEDLADTRVAQPLLYLADWAWGITLLDSGVEPVALAGHSLGELAALAVAGVYSVEAGLELVVERSKLMAAVASTNPGGMAAVLGLDAEVIAQTAEACKDIWVANDNSPGQVVISGTHQGITHATKLLAEAGARRIVELQVAGPFHSPLMEPAREAFERIVRAADFCDATVPLLQNTDPEPAVDAETIRNRLVGQITAPVRWTETIRRLAADGPIALIEAGPGSVLTGLARKMSDVRTFAVESTELEHIVEEVS